MKNIVVEIEGTKHRLVPVEAGEFSCGNCSLSSYCRGVPPKNTALICEKLSDEAIRLNLHFKLEK